MDLRLKHCHPVSVWVNSLNGWVSIQVRHEAQQDDKLREYGWLRHDGQSYGQQVLVDDDYNITLSMVRLVLLIV